MFLSKSLLVATALVTQVLGNAVTQPVTLAVGGITARVDESSAKAATKFDRTHARDFGRSADYGRVPIFQRDAPYQSHETHPSTFPSSPNTGSSRRGDDNRVSMLERDAPNQSHETAPSTFPTRPNTGNGRRADNGYPLLQRDAPNQSHETDPSTFPTRPNTGNE